MEATALSNERDGNPQRKHYKVAIIGAGATGLMCAHNLFNEGDIRDVVILEARDRIGGRIHSVKRKSPCILPGSDTNEDVEFIVDEGASWVHGTGVPIGKVQNGESVDQELNPIVELLQKTAVGDENVLQTKLDYIAPLNPWTKPREVMHSPLINNPYNRKTGIADQDDECPDYDHLALFCNGQQLGSKSPLIVDALDLHERLLDAVSKVGESSFYINEGMATQNISLAQALDVIRKYAPAKHGLGYNHHGGSIRSETFRSNFQLVL